MKKYAGERTQVFEARVWGGRSLSVSVEIGNDGVADKFWKRNELRISGHTSGYGSLAICCIAFRQEARGTSGQPVQVGSLKTFKLHLVRGKWTTYVTKDRGGRLGWG